MYSQTTNNDNALLKYVGPYRMTSTSEASSGITIYKPIGIVPQIYTVERWNYQTTRIYKFGGAITSSGGVTGKKAK